MKMEGPLSEECNKRPEKMKTDNLLLHKQLLEKDAEVATLKLAALNNANQAAFIQLRALAAEDKLTKAEARIQILVNQSEELEQEVSIARRAAEKLAELADEAEEEADELKAQLRELEGTIRHISAELHQTNTRLVEAEAARNKLAQQLEQANEDLRQKDEEILRLRCEEAEKRAALLKAIPTAQAEHTRTLEEFTSSLAALRAEHELRTKEDRHTYTQQVDLQKQKLAGLTHELQEEKRKSAKLEKDHQSLLQQLEVAKSQAEKQQTADFRKQISTLQSEIQLLKQVIRGLSDGQEVDDDVSEEDIPLAGRKGRQPKEVATCRTVNKGRVAKKDVVKLEEEERQPGHQRVEPKQAKRPLAAKRAVLQPTDTNIMEDKCSEPVVSKTSMKPTKRRGNLSGKLDAQQHSKDAEDIPDENEVSLKSKHGQKKEVAGQAAVQLPDDAENGHEAKDQSKQFKRGRPIDDMDQDMSHKPAATNIIPEAKQKSKQAARGRKNNTNQDRSQHHVADEVYGVKPVKRGRKKNVDENELPDPLTDEVEETKQSRDKNMDQDVSQQPGPDAANESKQNKRSRKKADTEHDDAHIPINTQDAADEPKMYKRSRKQENATKDKQSSDGTTATVPGGSNAQLANNSKDVADKSKKSTMSQKQENTEQGKRPAVDNLQTAPDERTESLKSKCIRKNDAVDQDTPDIHEDSQACEHLEKHSRQGEGTSKRVAGNDGAATAGDAWQESAKTEMNSKKDRDHTEGRQQAAKARENEQNGHRLSQSQQGAEKGRYTEASATLQGEPGGAAQLKGAVRGADKATTSTTTPQDAPEPVAPREAGASRQESGKVNISQSSQADEDHTYEQSGGAKGQEAVPANTGRTTPGEELDKRHESEEQGMGPSTADGDRPAAARYQRQHSSQTAFQSEFVRSAGTEAAQAKRLDALRSQPAVDNASRRVKVASILSSIYVPPQRQKSRDAGSTKQAPTSFFGTGFSLPTIKRQK